MIKWINGGTITLTFITLCRLHCIPFRLQTTDCGIKIKTATFRNFFFKTHAWCLSAVLSMCSLSLAKLSLSEKISVNLSKTCRSRRFRWDHVFVRRHRDALCIAERTANSWNEFKNKNVLNQTKQIKHFIDVWKIVERDQQTVWREACYFTLNNRWEGWRGLSE